MRIIFIYILIVLLSVDMGNAKPIYNITQLRSILNSHCKMIPGFPEVLGIHIYDSKEGKVLQLELEAIDKKSAFITLAMNAMAKIGQYSKAPINSFIIINHTSGVPDSYESNADCTIRHFIKKEITKRNWMKDCLSNSITQKKIDNWSELNLNKK